MRRVYLKSIEKLTPKDTADKYLKEDVFKVEAFKEHVNRTAETLDIHPEVVKDVLESYWSNIFYILNTVQKINLKINVYGFFSLVYTKGRTLYAPKKKKL